MINPVTTAEAIVSFLQSATPGHALSLGRAVAQIRSMDPHCDLTDRQLVDIIASNALAMGFPAILFDLEWVQSVKAEPVGKPAPLARAIPGGGRDVASVGHTAALVDCGRRAVRQTHRAMILILAVTASVLVGCQTYSMSPPSHGIHHPMQPPANCAMTGSTCESPG